MKFPNHQVDQLFNVLDVDGGGTLSFEEFAAIAEAEKEIQDVEALWEEDLKNQDSDTDQIRSMDEIVVEEEMMKKVAALVVKAVHSGTRFTHSSAVAGDIKLQGSALMLTPAAIRKRDKLKEDREIQRQVHQYPTRTVLLCCTVFQYSTVLYCTLLVLYL